MFSFSEIIFNKVNYFLNKIAQKTEDPIEILSKKFLKDLEKSRADILKEINKKFNQIRFDKNEWETKLNSWIADIKKYLPGSINEQEIKDEFNKKIKNFIEAKKIAQDSLNFATLNDINYDRIWFFYTFKNIRDLLIQDIEIKGKKEINAYFPFYQKIERSVGLNIAEIVYQCQLGIYKCYRQPPISIGSYEESNQDKLMRRLDAQSPLGNLMYSSAVHTIRPGARVEPKRIHESHYLSPPDREFKEEKINILNKVFESIGIHFTKENLQDSSLKLRTYTELTNDNEITFPFLKLINEIHTENQGKNEETFITNYINSLSFQEIKTKEKKLKAILSLVFNPTTIDTLKKYKIVQMGDEVKLVEDPNKSPMLINLTTEELKKLHNQAKNISAKSISAKDEIINYSLYSLGLKIDNLFKIRKKIIN